MSTLAKRLLLGFAAGALSHLVFQGLFGTALYVAGLAPTLPYSLAPVPPLGVPRSASWTFWAALWGVAYAWVEPRVTERLGWLPGGVVFGVALPLMVHWLVVLPSRGLGIGGGFHPQAVPIEVGYHAVFGLGLAILLAAGLNLVAPPRRLPLPVQRT